MIDAKYHLKSKITRKLSHSKLMPTIPTAHIRSMSKLLTISTARANTDQSQFIPKNSVAKALIHKKNHQRSSSVAAIMPTLKSITSQGLLKSTWDSLNLPITPGVTLQLFRSQLTDFEQSEILSFPKIYYIGFGIKKLGSEKDSQWNLGFDDERADYILVKGDHIGYRYEILQILGKGSFGQVIKAFDHKEKIDIALKIIRNKQKFHNQAKIELQILRTLKDNDMEDSGIVHIKEHLVFRNHLCISFELLNINLYHYLKINQFKGMSINMIRKFTEQILKGLRLIHSLNIIHCDLKPENILFKTLNDYSIKIIDFGSACFDDQKMYSYIQSRYYRAPEVILGLGYSDAIDM